MMKFLKILAPVAASVLWWYGLSHSFQVSGNALPPLGSFFSPSVGFWKNAQEPDPGLQKEITGLPVEGRVIFDDRMVPHIFAPDLYHACFIQGYVHAMHRLWQMDFATRAAEGRISEIIGAKAIDFDKTKRRKGLVMSAKASIEAWKKHPEAYALAQAYADGINAFIQQLTDAELPIEFKLMNYKPEPWSPYRSALFHKSMAEILCGRDMDVEMTNAKKFFGEEFAYFFNEIDSLTDPVIPRGTAWNFEREKTDPAIVPDSSMGYIDWVREPGSSGIGSNNWAVAGSKSATGNPILCNDPHLMLTLPSVWYEQQIQTPEMNVYGVTFAGIPGVVIGFNKDISWGVTNAGWDVLDWYRIKWKDENKTAYAYGDGWQETEKRVERIRVKDAADVIDTILITKWGPVVFDDPHHKRNGLAMHWIISERFENVELKTFMELNQSKNLEDYKKAIRHFPYPAQNFAFASTNGDIGITVQGRMPIKADQQGRFVMDGSNPDHAWKGFLDEARNPQIVNPSRGFISSANQRSTDLSYPNYYNNGDFRDYRGTLINRLLASKDKWSVEDMKMLQYNAYSLRAETALPALLQAMETSALDGEGRSILEQLQNWDYQYASDRMEPAYFEWWFQYFYKMVWDELLLDSTMRAVGVPSDQSTIAFLKQKPTHRYFDRVATPEKEDARTLVRMAFDSVLIFRRQHPEVKSWTDYKDASITHIARIPAFSRAKVSAPGTKDVINAHGRTEGPSWRMIVELDKSKIEAYGIYPGGQSGNPGSRYYDQMIDDWSRGKYYKLHFMSGPEDLPNPIFTIQFRNSK